MKGYLVPLSEWNWVSSLTVIRMARPQVSVHMCLVHIYQDQCVIQVYQQSHTLPVHSCL